MNKLEKFFNTLSSNNPRLLKKYVTEELTSQIKEYIDFTPYICKNIYKLLISHDSDDRINGACILKSIMFQFKLITNFTIEYKDNNEEYLSSTGEEFECKKISISEQKRILKKMADLEHVNENIVDEIDFKADSNITIKKQKVKDKPIENVNDFFENISNNLLNYEWNKRHGAFLAYQAIFDSNCNGTMEINIDSSLFLKIYEILKSDKFNDFIEDQTVAPVREAAASLLASIYPRIPKNNIIHELTKFLDDKDWQTQYSGLLALKKLKEYILNPKEICEKLCNLLSAKDEDVKFLAADLLCFFYDECDKEIVFEKCIENLKLDEEISVSKVSIINLLSKSSKPIDDLSILFNYFISPVPDVRKAVLKYADKLDDESLTFLIGELILIDDKSDIRSEAIDILRRKNTLSIDFYKQFMKIVGTPLYEPYDKNEFVSYDELYFTSSGIKVLDKSLVLQNRIDLAKILNEKCRYEKYESSNKTIIGEIFYTMHDLYQHVYLGKIKEYQEKLKVEYGIENLKRVKLNSDFESNSIVENNELILEIEKIREMYNNFQDLHYLPIKELINKIRDPDSISMHPYGNVIFLDYLRYITVEALPDISISIYYLFIHETCTGFLESILEILLVLYDKCNISLDLFLENSFKYLLNDHKNFALIFQIFGNRIFIHPIYQRILKDERKLDFFKITILFYETDLEKLEFIFDEAYEKRIVEILIGFLRNIKYTEMILDRLLENLDLNLLEQIITYMDHSYYPVLVKPLLKLVTVPEEQKKASCIVASIIPKLNFRINSEVSEKYKKLIIDAKNDLECLLDSKKIPEYIIKVPTSLVLRKYQIEGIKWINFLYKFNLNGILADDMGLGKTIQVLAFICSEIYQTNLKALIICPSSLTGHWKSEIDSFFPDIKAWCFNKNKSKEYDILIVSYETFRNYYQKFANEDWFYVVFDEGHLLRNSNTLLYQRILQIKCTRRLLLTGTPVHNSIDDLVSIFNLIMPNYLGEMKTIPYMNSKMSDSEINSIHEVLENLNRKILPFVLRRLKVDVLKDLPPKIIRDITIEMGPVQREIYKKIEDGNKSEVEDLNYKNIYKKTEGLKRTRDLLNACSHIRYFEKSKEVSCKIKALEDIINFCGGEDIRNKILIFFQYKSTIDYVIEDFQTKFNLKYLRLDGSVPASKRSKIASDFNSGSIPVLFLTTHIGGLGLNLTGADTVIFYEHDWNPFNDLQAMDRAHRIGQRKTVNVFRLVTKDTIEEKVMDLQSFKVFIASSVVSQQNTNIETMDTKDLLERFGQ